jgi:uncharacterized protein YndB with AHSA1/START domain
MFRAWTTATLLPEWFCPKPWMATDCEVDLKSGGRFKATMKSPEGQEIPCSGCYLEVIENRRIVWTDALTAGYRPAERPFMTAEITFEKHPEGTRYVVIAKHATEAARKQHEEMGFFGGWNICVDQMVALYQRK